MSHRTIEADVLATEQQSNEEAMSDTVQFTSVDHVLFEIRELKHQVPDLAEGLGILESVVLQRSGEPADVDPDAGTEEIERATEARDAAIAGAATFILGNVTELMKNRKFKAKDELMKSPQKFDHYMKQQGPKGRDPQGRERQRQEHVTKKYKD